MVWCDVTCYVGVCNGVMLHGVVWCSCVLYDGVLCYVVRCCGLWRGIV